MFLQYKVSSSVVEKPKQWVYYLQIQAKAVTSTLPMISKW